ncbi:bifunctional diguanylate cyclase/phosphodiesterase [Motiliproteus sp. SC1-56]|uniref:putative bifunctional diguanylate cyclase/phosphodiesterase n=1 Tax=Motiliproteus sp. SC1-56 TaxID=2799565 RepID=UPI001A8F3688|nr:EAL domain-containing protein [Motiliproteus sp. SC1-56]
MKWGLAGRLGLTLGLGLMLALGGNALLVWHQQEEAREQQLLERGRAVGELVASISAGALRAYDLPNLDAYLQRAAGQQGVVYAAIYDAQGRPLAQAFGAAYAQSEAQGSVAVGAAPATLLSQLRERVGVVPMSFPVGDGTSQVGTFNLGLERPTGTAADQRLFWTQLAIFMFSGLVIGGLCYRLYRQRFVQPVASLIEALRLTARGEYRQLPRQADNELAGLQEAFNGMVQGLEEDREKLHHQANYDALTGLPNRMLAIERLGYEISRSQREEQRLALLFVDLNDFKLINESLGHAAGDQMLEEVGARLRSCLRDVDTIARLGGDEFLLLLPGSGDRAEIEAVGQRLIQAVNVPLPLPSQELIVHCSIGVARYPEDGDSVDTLMANADNAMHQAKLEPQSTLCFFQPAMTARVQQRVQMEQDLHRALERGELELHYQPLVDAGNGRPRGAEVLLRWQHPERGMVSPAEFIPLAETTGQIIAIGEWVLEQAGRQWAQWSAEGLTPGYLAVNISRVQFQRNLAWTLGRVLAHYRLPPSALELEITEGVLLEDHELVRRELNELRAMGIRLALDDFGTGFSSLNYLKRFHFDVLKIDRTFVAGLPRDAEDVSLVKAVIAMAHGMELEVIAEGVEDQAQFEFLQQQGCDLCQGYYFSRPLNAAAYRDYLRQAHSRDSASLMMPGAVVGAERRRHPRP